MPEAKSFLGSVKEEITAQFAGVFDDLSPVCSDGDRLATSLQTLQKKAWGIVEAKLKESFRNGQKAAGKKPDEPSAPAKVNPFRKG
jgi:hypothetical protein